MVRTILGREMMRNGARTDEAFGITMAADVAAGGWGSRELGLGLVGQCHFHATSTISAAMIPQM
jgi:hypothetical protein